MVLRFTPVVTSCVRCSLALALAGTCCALDSLVFARDIKVGDIVFAASAGYTTLPTAVKSVETIIRAGRFNVHTLNGNIVVDGIVSSHFTSETNWGASSRSYAPIWYKMTDVANQLLGAEDVRTQAGNQASGLRGRA